MSTSRSSASATNGYHSVEIDQDFDVLDSVLSAVPSFIMMVDANRRVVYANRAMLDFLDVSGEEVLGSTPGELMGCLNALEGEGCGFASACEYCGANRALQEAWRGLPTVQECHIMRIAELDPPALSLRIWATPITLQGTPLVLIAAVDISDEERRQELERIFFHDILNTATIIDGTVKLLLTMEPDEDAAHVKSLLNQVAERLIEEIMRQRDFTALETRQLKPQAAHVEVHTFLAGLVDSYLSHDAAGVRNIRIDPATPPVALTIDKALLGRVLGNLLKNAVEASDAGQPITLGCRQDGAGRVEFWVHNASVMSDEVRTQVFQRAFSTKGRGRGLGTYSARLLTERYLEGEINFTSEPGSGTIFRVAFPLMPSYADGDIDGSDET
jgi:signal transduction histidine kinase